MSDREVREPGEERSEILHGGATRRRVLTGFGAVGVAGVLAACGDGATGSDNGPQSSSGQAGGPVDIKVADVPVGGGLVVEGKNVVVTQPAAGTFKAFSATCTHQGCLVSSVSGDKIVCACHGSQFSAADGSVVRGPARQRLPAKDVTVTGDTLKIT